VGWVHGGTYKGRRWVEHICGVQVAVQSRRLRRPTRARHAVPKRELL
jgi:hypothetical protein